MMLQGTQSAQAKLKKCMLWIKLVIDEHVVWNISKNIYICFRNTSFYFYNGSSHSIIYYGNALQGL